MRLSAVDDKGKKANATVACSGLWAKVDAISASYDLPDNLCWLCGLLPDTLHDRLWNCQHPEVENARARTATKSVVAKARKADNSSILYCRGLLPHPADVLPRPAATPSLSVKKCDKYVDFDTLDIGGEVFLDGSCDTHLINELRRAAFAVVERDDQGKDKNVIIGTVTADWLQTAQSSEYFAAL